VKQSNNYVEGFDALDERLMGEREDRTYETKPNKAKYNNINNHHPHALSY
jgi:hypothetical protein